jgi:vacuolar-type H+-ATPase subunit D/Vma8
MEKGSEKCEISINSIVSMDISRRELVRFRDRINYLEINLLSLEGEERALQKRITELMKEIGRLRSLFDASFGEQIRGILDAEEVEAELKQERLRAEIPAQITLGISEITREHILSVMDVIRRISEEIQGPAPMTHVKARVKEIGISADDFEEILGRLRRAGALIESNGTLRLI